ncbi:MAG: molybdenum cofactor biosynthesis protein MoaE [Verrucomicrobiota bacterium]
MDITIRIGPEVIVPATPVAAAGTGAVATFLGTIRAEENGATIGGLHYEAYQPMAEAVMRDILGQLAIAHPCRTVFVQHRTGPVRVGEAAIYIEAHAAHRAEAFALLAGFMDRLKQDVPIWKTDVIP